jgi:hypothetical protein
MPKKDISTGEMIISDTGNWNVASDFARIKIMVPLAKCDYFEDIAKFGSESIIEELMGFQLQDDFVRYTGLKRLINELLKICKNSKFAMKKGKTKETLGNYEKELKRIKNVLHLLVKIRKDDINKTKELTIINEKFDKALDIVLEIKSSINTPLNQNHLIFTDREEFDIRAYKKLQKERMTQRG